MNRLPAIDIAEDLEIVSQEEITPKPLQEDLKADPFQRAPPLTNFSAVVEPLKKPKKAVSDKQKAHLANARKLARERKAELKKQQEQAKINEDKNTKIKDTKVLAEVLEKEAIIEEEKEEVEIEQEHIRDTFNEFLSNMDRYSNLMKKAQQEEEIKRAELELKEAEQEAKYFAKFKKLHLATATPSKVSKPIPMPECADIITQKENQYGIYGNYF